MAKQGRVGAVASKIEVHIVVAPVFATNTCILVADDGADRAAAGGQARAALIVDAGAGVADTVIEQVESHGWQVKAVAATHGHADHTWDAGPLAEHFGVPFLINAADKYRIDDPIGTLQPKDARPDQSVAVAIAHAAKAAGAGEYVKPANIITFGASLANSSDGDVVVSGVTETGAKLKVGSIELDLIFAPGHTEGSTLYAGPDFVLSGDVLFAGSIGRTDLPGGDSGTMTKTLQRLAKELDLALHMIPGHGPLSTVQQELATNPYWRAALSE